jgi:hypothetical protein
MLEAFAGALVWELLLLVVVLVAAAFGAGVLMGRRMR